MKAEISLKFTGIEDVDRALRIIPKKLNKKVLNSAYRKGATILIKDARSRLPVGESQNLKKSIGTETVKADNDEAAVRVGPRRKKKKPSMQGWHSHLVEYGTKSRSPVDKKKLVFRNKQGKRIFVDSVAPMKAQPFMRPAIDATKSQVQEKIRIEIGNVLEKELRRRLLR